MENEFFPKSDCAILVGSGISDWGDLGLPSGQRVVDELVNRLITPEGLISNYNQATLSNKIFELDKFVNNTPFELLLNGHPDHQRLRELFSKIYRTKESNIVHESIAEQVKLGVISFIVSANYDNCLELALEKMEVEFNLIVEETDLLLFDDDKPTLFKIHGCVTREESLVITLLQESRLPDWKINFLHKKLTRHFLCIFGFSGNDFDICPVLFSPSLKTLGIKWLHRNPSKKAAYNARSAESNEDVVLYKGEFKNIFTSVGDKPESCNKGSEPLIENMLNGLSDDEIHRWKFDLYNNLSLGRFMEIICNNYKESDEAKSLQQKSDIEERKGLYLDGVDSLDKARHIYKGRGNEIEVFRCWLMSAGRYSTGGFPFRMTYRLYKAWLHFRSFKDSMSEEIISGYYYLFGLYLVGAHLFFKKYMFFIFGRNFFKNVAKKYLDRAVSNYDSGSNWQQIYMCKVQTDRLDKELDSEDDHPTLATNEGFRHLNNIVGISGYRWKNVDRYDCDIFRAYDHIRRLLYLKLFPAIHREVLGSYCHCWNKSPIKLNRLIKAAELSINKCQIPNKDKSNVVDKLNRLTMAINSDISQQCSICASKN